MMQKAFQTLLPSMINVIQQTLDAGDEPGARHVFDVFETLLILVRSIGSIGFFHPILTPIVGNPYSQPAYPPARPVPPPMWREPQL